MRKIISTFIREEAGAAMVEYTALLGIITVAVLLTVIGVGTWVSGQWTSLCTNLGAGASTDCTPATA